MTKEIMPFGGSLITNNETPAIYLTRFTEDLISKFRSGDIGTDKGEFYSPETIRSYIYFLDTWKKFEEKKGIEYNFNQVSPVLTKGFTNFLQTEGKSKNSISLILSKLKAVLKFAFLEGLCFWNGSGIKTPTELTTKIYLSISELRKLRETEVTQSQERVLAGFIIQCFTGLRYDTLQQFLENPYAYIKEFEGYSYIDIISDKTGEQSIIPLGNTVLDILSKYGDIKLNFSEQYTNRVLKIIGEKSQLTNAVATQITKGMKKVKEIKEKKDLITTHSARRTFISLAKQSEMTDREIQGVTGHKTETQLNAYNRSTNLEKVKGIFGNKFFDTEI